MSDPNTLSQLSLGGICVTLLGGLVTLFFMYVKEKDLRIGEAATYAEKLSQKDKEVQKEKDSRIGDAQLYAKAHNESTREAYKFETSFSEMGESMDLLAKLIHNRIEAAENRERTERERRERDLQDENQRLRTGKTTGPQLPFRRSNHDDEG